MLAVLVGSDAYPLVLWTISKWNFSDAASRAHEAKAALIDDGDL
jgi:hypothetical protein